MLVRWVLPLLFLLVGCGGAQKVGVRPSFSNASISKVAVVDIYATGEFSLDEPTFRNLVDLYTAAVEQSARELGFEVVTRAQFDASFADATSLLDFRSSLPTTQSLSSWFEGENRDSIEVETVVRIAPKLPTRALLFAEIVYYSVGYCEANPTKFNAYAELSSPAEGDCVVSHFQAKLIDATTGDTMWHNRGFVEHRSSDARAVQSQIINQNVRNVLQNRDGLGALRPSS